MHYEPTTKISGDPMADELLEDWDSGLLELNDIDTKAVDALVFEVKTLLYVIDSDNLSTCTLENLRNCTAVERVKKALSELEKAEAKNA